MNRLQRLWTRFWMRRAGRGPAGRMATRLATWMAPPYYARKPLAKLSPAGYIAPAALIHHPHLSLGRHVFIGDRVVIFRDQAGGTVTLEDRVHLYGDSFIQTGGGGQVHIGADTHIQPRCQFSAYLGSIRIGRDVQIAPGCAFYPYDHGFSGHEPIRRQPLVSRGDIEIGDDAWLGYGVIVLSGVRIGNGAVIGAGSVVTRDVPDGAIAAGSPARVIKQRESWPPPSDLKLARSSASLGS